MTRQEATRQIAEKLDAAKKLVRECETIADENDVEFSFNPTDEYGMGGSYTPKRTWDSSGCSEWDSSGCYEEREEGGWNSSSQNC